MLEMCVWTEMITNQGLPVLSKYFTANDTFKCTAQLGSDSLIRRINHMT